MVTERESWWRAARRTACMVAGFGGGLATIGCAPEIVPEAESGGDASEPASSSPVRRAPSAAGVGAGEAPPPGQGAAAEVSFTMVEVAAGAEFEIELTDPIRVGERRPGDRFRAAVLRPLIEHDMVLVPLNSLVRGEITAIGRSADGRAMVKLRFVEVFFNGRGWPVTASVASVRPAGLGAPGGEAETILGRLLGGDPGGGFAGAAGGATGGTVIPLPEADGSPGLEVGAILKLRLDEPFVFGLPNI